MTTEVYEYRCHRVTEADGSEDGFVPARCGFNAAVVSIGFDEGLCLDCLREIGLDEPKPLPLRDPLVWA